MNARCQPGNFYENSEAIDAIITPPQISLQPSTLIFNANDQQMNSRLFAPNDPFLSMEKSQYNYKKSSASSLAGTIGSTSTTANYSDSEVSINSYRGSNASSSSIAPSVSSLNSGFSVSTSGISRNSNNSSHNGGSISGTSNQNRHHINNYNSGQQNRSGSSGGGSLRQNNRNIHHSHQRAGSVSSNSKTDVSSVYSSVPSYKTSETHSTTHGTNNHHHSSSSSGATQQQSASRSYHPYRR